MPLPRAVVRSLFIAPLFAFLAGCADETGSTASYAPAVRLLVFSDPHYFAPALGATGSAFESYLAQDRKLIAESDAILRAMADVVVRENPQAVLIPGDITKDGELLSHQGAVAYLREMQTGGRRVYVVPGNHDIWNASASSYAGDVATPVAGISNTDFADLYQELGYRDARARDPASLSYVAELVPGLWLLAIDSCIYGQAPGASQSSGRIADSTRGWIKAELDEARRLGVRVVAMMHHGLVEHFTGEALIFSEYLVQDRDAIAELLSGGSVGAILTGHFHAHDIAKATMARTGRAIYDIETGSTVTFPCPYRVIDVASDIFTITTGHLTAIDYDLGGAADFQTYAHASLRLGLETLIASLITVPPYSLAADRAAAIAPWLGDGLVAHYAGDEVPPASAMTEARTLLSSENATEKLAGFMLQSIYTDLPPADNTVTLDLTAKP